MEKITIILVLLLLYRVIITPEEVDKSIEVDSIPDIKSKHFVHETLEEHGNIHARGKEMIFRVEKHTMRAFNTENTEMKY